MLHEPCIVRTRWHSRTLNFAAELSRGEGDREVECCGTISIVELEFSPPNSGKCLVLFDGKKVRWLLHGIDQCGYAMAWALRGEQGADDPPHPSKPKVTLRDLCTRSKVREEDLRFSRNDVEVRNSTYSIQN